MPRPRGVLALVMRRGSPDARRAPTASWSRRAPSTIESPIRRCSGSIASTVTSTSSPTLTTCFGCEMRRSRPCARRAPARRRRARSRRTRRTLRGCAPCRGRCVPTGKRSATVVPWIRRERAQREPDAASAVFGSGSIFTTCASTGWPTCQRPRRVLAARRGRARSRGSGPRRRRGRRTRRSRASSSRCPRRRRRPRASPRCARRAARPPPRAVAARDDDVPPAAFDLGDAEAQALADVLRGSRRRRSICDAGQNARTPADLHVEAALVLPPSRRLRRRCRARAPARARLGRGRRARASS